MFTHLHTHTEFSLLDGMSKIAPLMDRAQAQGMEAIAMTDHGALYGAIDFYREARKRNIKPIIGVEAYIAKGSRHSRERSEASPYHQVLLAQNMIGYKNLIAMVTKANLEGFYYKPRIDRELLEQHNEGIIALSGCPSGDFLGRLLEGDRDGAIEVARWYKERFEGRYYLEVQEHNIDRFSAANPLIAEIGRELDIPVVATNDGHFTDPEEVEGHEVLLCIGTNATMDQENRFRLDGDGYHLRSSTEMEALFPENPEFIANTMRVAELCDLELSFDRQLLPEPPIPEGRESAEYLAEICRKGLEKRAGAVTPELQERLDYELDVLSQTGFTDYIYVVKEISDYARSRNIGTGVRGSAAASLVLYSLGVTDIDPVANRLVFERFLNLERREMPDVDFDFADDRREEVIQWTYNHYGTDRVAQIITFGTLGAKAAIRDVGRALGMSYNDTDRVARLVPNALHITLQDALDQSNEMKELYDGSAEVKRLLDTAQQLEGVARHASTHAAGVVISRDPLADHVPLQRPSKGDETSVPTTQFAMDQVASIGLLKMDFLGLSNLTILSHAVDLVHEMRGDESDQLLPKSLFDLPDADAKTMEMLGNGETFGVFQLESAGMRRYVQDLGPKNIADLCALVALYRPGPMQHIPRYIQAAHGDVEVTHPHDDLSDILDETYGVIVYQDQVMLIVQKFAGYTLGQADVMRKAMGKKKKDIMEAERGSFVTGAMAKGYTKAEAVSVFELIEPFAGYAFNKAHSWSYGNIAYQTAFLKANHPVEYMTALMRLTRNSPDTHDRIGAATAEARRLGIDILGPNVNSSRAEFSIETRQDGSPAIRFGLGVIKNVGAAAIEGIVEARVKEGPFRDVEDFCKRADLSSATSRTIEHLAMAGAFDDFEQRGTMRANSERIVKLAKLEREKRETGQLDLFGNEASQPMAIELTEAPSNQGEMLEWERELLGTYILEHPLNAVSREMEGNISHSVAELNELAMEMANHTVTAAGMLANVTARATRDGRRFYIVDFEDMSGTIELTVWDDTIKQTGDEHWSSGQIMLVEIECRDRGDRLALSIREAHPWDRTEGKLLGFSPEKWNVEPRKMASRRRANGSSESNRSRPQVARRPSAPVAATTEAASPTVTPPVENTARLMITIYETENEAADKAVLSTVVRMLDGKPGGDEVRLVIHDAEGTESEFDLPSAKVDDELARSIEQILAGNKGTARLTKAAAVV